MSRSFLAEAVARAQEESTSPDYDRGVPRVRPRPPPSLREAIDRERSGGAIVVEYKRASPATRRPWPHPRTVSEFLAATQVGGVVGYSCLATSHGFDGAPARVAELVAGTDRPVLFKEFVVHPRQLEVAARTGAAAVLLIARLGAEGLLEEPLSGLAAEAHRHGLEVLLELHDSAELSLVDDVETDVYGVNTRDLDTLSLDRPRAYATLDRAVRDGLRPLLGLSGVEGAEDAHELWSHGCDGLLVGTAVARSRAPAALLASLRRTGGGAA